MRVIVTVVTFPLAIILVAVGVLCGLCTFHQVAYRVFDIVCALQPNWDLSYWSRATALRHMGEFHHAIADYNRAAAIGISDLRLYFYRGLAYFETKQYNFAIDDFTVCLRVHIEIAAALFWRGLAYEYTEKYALSVLDLQDCLKYNPSFRSDILPHFGYVLLKLKEYQYALEIFDEIIQNTPNASVLLNRGVALEGLDRYTEANQSYTAAALASEDRVRAIVLYNRGLGYLRLNNIQAAEQDFAECIKLDGSRLDARCVLLWLHYENEDTMRRELQSITEAHVVPQKGTVIVVPYMQDLCSGILVGIDGYWQNGLALIDRAINYNIDQSLGYFWQGMAYAYLNKRDDALAAFAKAQNEKLPLVLFRPIIWLQRDNNEIFSYIKFYIEADTDK